MLRLPLVQVDGPNKRDVHAQVAVDATALDADEGAHRGRGPAGACVKEGGRKGGREGGVSGRCMGLVI